MQLRKDYRRNLKTETVRKKQDKTYQKGDVGLWFERLSILDALS